MYTQIMTVKDEHIDFQGIMDGLYYPFYMEECRHKFLKDEVGIDIEEYAKNGLNLVLVEYSLKFKSSLHKGDKVEVSCNLIPEECSRIKFVVEQKISCNGKIAAEAKFTATAVKAAGGRPFVPQELNEYLTRLIEA